MKIVLASKSGVRKEILRNIIGVKNIVRQDIWSYSKNILKYKPDIFVHGDDWKKSDAGIKLRNNTIAAIKKIKGKLIEIPYTKDISSTSLHEKMFERPQLQTKKENYLSRIIQSKDICRILETHSPLSAIIAEHSKFKNKKKQYQKIILESTSGFLKNYSCLV